MGGIANIRAEVFVFFLCAPLSAHLAQDIPFLLRSRLKPCVAIDLGVGQYGERMLDAVVGNKVDVEASHSYICKCHKVNM